MQSLGNFLQKFHSATLTPKKLAAGFLDVVICAVSTALIALTWADFEMITLVFLFLVSAAIAIPLLAAQGAYQSVFRYAGPSTVNSIARAMAMYGAIYAGALFILDFDSVPRHVALFQPALMFCGLLLVRTSVRYAVGSGTEKHQVEKKRVLIYGAGECGQALVQSLRHDRNIEILGFLDDDESLHGTKIDSVKVFNPKSVLKDGSKIEVSNILLALPSVPAVRRRDIIEDIRKANVGVQTVPSLSEMQYGTTRVSDLRELSATDLLGRSVVEPDPALMIEKIKGKIVCVTGAGGSIGAELCRQIVMLEPSALVLVDHSEHALYEINRTLSTLRHSVPVSANLGSVRDQAWMQRILRQHRPDILFHAAAYKHVPLVEENAAEGIRNNVWGTLNMALAAQECGVKSFVLISTDKAVRPTNIMGASKRLAEIVLQALDEESKGTDFSMVRFGNVLDSSGSVVPLFRQQINDGGPITLTHSEVTRYFMTIPEAAQLVVQSLSLTRGGDVFVLDMGSPVKIAHLAKRMVELSGLTLRDESNADGDIEIRVTGLRRGEKLYEELLIGDNPEATAHPKIMRAQDVGMSYSELQTALAELDKSLNQGIEETKTFLCKLPLNYHPSELKRSV